MVFDFAIKKLKIITENPALDLDYPVKRSIDENSVENFYDPNELLRFEECMVREVERTKTLKWKAIFLLLAYTGMRKGEALALEWDDINFNQETIRISKTLTRGINNRLIIQPPKTEKSNRTVSIKNNHKLISLLYDWKQECHLKNEITGVRPSKLVFPSAKNFLLDPNSLNPTLDKIIERYNLKRITVHGFRHTHITILFLGGASIKQVQDRVGHGDVQTTMDIYHHVMQESREETPQLFADTLNKFKS
jgi:integrase